MADFSLGMTTVLSSTPAVSHVAGVATDHPEISRSIAQDDSIERLRKDKEEVLKSDETSTDMAIKDEDSGKRQAFAGQEGGREKAEEKPDEAPEEYNENPWSGNIVNKRI